MAGEFLLKKKEGNCRLHTCRCVRDGGSLDFRWQMAGVSCFLFFSTRDEILYILNIFFSLFTRIGELHSGDQSSDKQPSALNIGIQ